MRGRGRPDRRRLVRRDRPADRAGPRARGAAAGAWSGSPSGVEAHTHEFIATAHEDQKFGFSLGRRRGVRGGGPDPATRTCWSCVGLHSHIGSQIFDACGFEVAARRVLGLQDADPRREFGVELPELDLGGGFGIAYTTQDDPATPADLAERLRKIVEQECAARSAAGAAPVDRAGPGASSARPCSPSTRSARSRTSTASAPTSASTAG